MSATAPLPEPDEPGEKNPSGTGALAQNSNTPLGWKPTRSAPVPVVRCTQIKKDGIRCGRWSLRGYDKCIKHAGPGAKMPDGNVNKYAEAVIEAARLRLVDDSDAALEVLSQLMNNVGTAENVRLKAATEVLDRAGIRGGFEVKTDVQVTLNPSDTVSERLEKLREGAEAVTRMQAEARARRDGEEADIVEGEIVDDPDEPTLF